MKHQTIIAKANNSKYNAKSTRNIKRYLKSSMKLRNPGVIIMAYVEIDYKMVVPITKNAITKCDRENTSREMGRPM